MKFLRTFFADLFKGPTGHWDFGRFGAFHAISVYSFSFLYALIWLQKVPDWSNLGIGYTAVLGGSVALIAGKDISVARAQAIGEGTTNAGNS